MICFRQGRRDVLAHVVGTALVRLVQDHQEELVELVLCLVTIVRREIEAVLTLDTIIINHSIGDTAPEDTVSWNLTLSNLSTPN